MRTLSTRAWVVCLALAVAGAAGAGCNRNQGENAAAEPQAADMSAALVEERDEGKLEWVVSPEGQVHVRVTTNEGGSPAVSGALLIDGQSYDLKAEGATLAATGPKLAAELTTITYSLKVGDATWNGALDVPPGGTKELVAAPSIEIPEGTRGPNGGIVDVIGEQRVEIVTDENTGEVRVYFLDENMKVVPVGDATAVMAFSQQQEQEEKQ